MIFDKLFPRNELQKKLYFLSRFQIWILQSIMADTLRQGNQDGKIESFLVLFVQLFKREYPEDNEVTLRHFLIERLQAAFSKELKLKKIDVKGIPFQMFLNTYELKLAKMSKDEEESKR